MSKDYYIKDDSTKAILNTNRISYEEYKRQRTEINRVQSLEIKMECLSNEICEIKELMYKIFKGR